MTYTNKTQPTDISSDEYLKLNFGDDEKLQKEAKKLVDFYTKATGKPCIMWNKLFGYGKYYYKDSGGGEHDYMMTGFAISKTGFTLYNLLGWKNYSKDIEKIGKYKLSGTSCLAIKSVDDIDLKVLKKVTKKILADMKSRYRTE